MIKSEILDMPAGRKLDALIAEKIFGYKWVEGILAFGAPCLISPQRYEKDKDTCSTHLKYTNKRRDDGTFPKYSIKISDGWKVLDEIRSRQIPVEIKGDEWYDGKAWLVNIYDITGNQILYSAKDETNNGEWKDINPCLAICHAALLMHYNIK